MVCNPTLQAAAATLFAAVPKFSPEEPPLRRVGVLFRVGRVTERLWACAQVDPVVLTCSGFSFERKVRQRKILVVRSCRSSSGGDPVSITVPRSLQLHSREDLFFLQF